MDFLSNFLDSPFKAEETREGYERAIASGDTVAMINLGYMYLHGNGVPQNFAKAKELYEKAIALGNTMAITHLGNMYSMGKGVAQDFAKAKDLYEQAIALGDFTAMNNLGYMYHQGKGVPQDFAKAIELYERAVALESTLAMKNLGHMYMLGQGVPQDHNRAKELFEHAAALGDEGAKEHLDNFYYQEQDYQQRCFKHIGLIAQILTLDKINSNIADYEIFKIVTNELKSPETRNVLLSTPTVKRVSAFNAALGFNLFSRGMYEDSFELICNTKYQDAPEINFALGVMYDQGLGTKINKHKAQTHLNFATEQSCAAAMSYLAFKSCITHDISCAFSWFEKAANSNDPFGLCAIGFANLVGIMVMPDHSKALSYFEQASSNYDCAVAEFMLGLIALDDTSTDFANADYELALQHMSKTLKCIVDTPNPTYLERFNINGFDKATLEVWTAYTQTLNILYSSPEGITSSFLLSRLESLAGDVHLSTESEADKNCAYLVIYFLGQFYLAQESISLSDFGVVAGILRANSIPPLDFYLSDHCFYLARYLLGLLCINHDATNDFGLVAINDVVSSKHIKSRASNLKAAAAFKLGLYYESLSSQSDDDTSNLHKAIDYFKLAASESSSSTFPSFDCRNIYRLKALIKLCQLLSDPQLSKVTTESLPFYQQSVAEGLVDAGLALGNWYCSKSKAAEAIDAYKLTAQAGNTQAQLLLGQIYHSNPAFLDQVKARKLFESALGSGLSEAALPLGEILELDQEHSDSMVKVFDLYLQAACSGNAEAQFRLGRCYLQGQGTEVSAQKALSWLEKAAAQQHPQALFKLAQMYDSGQDVPLNQNKANDFYQLAASLGSVEAKHFLVKRQLFSGEQENTQELLQQLKALVDNTTILNFCLEKLAQADTVTGKSEQEISKQKTEKDQALTELKELASTGMLEAMVALAQFYESSDDDYAKEQAQIYHSLAAKQDHVPSFLAMADFAWSQQDYKSAIDWCNKFITEAKKAVNQLSQGSVSEPSANTQDLANNTGFRVSSYTEDYWNAALPRACFKLGDCYKQGLGVEADYKIAADWYSKASDLGHIGARLELALLYLNGGKGFKADERQAITLLNKLAKRKVAAGQYELGKAYLAGQGVKADPKQAFAMIKAAAEQKHPEAMALLSELYSKGTGTAANPNQAQSWLRKAKAAGWTA